MFPWRRIRLILLVVLICLLFLAFINYFREFSASSQPELATSLLHFNNSGLHWDSLPVHSKLSSNEKIEISHRIHGFYYAWYDAPQNLSNKYSLTSNNNNNNNNNWTHWNHPRLRHWNAKVASGYSTESHYPPYLIASSFFPKLGPYSSKDIHIIRIHMEMARFAGIGVLVVSWYPHGMSDDNGKPVDDLVLPLLNIANEYGIKVCLHLEPYKNRDVGTIVKDLKYIHTKDYTTHPAYYRLPVNHLGDKGKGQSLPVFYVYDSYRIRPSEWKKILQPDSRTSIRDKPYNGFLIGLLLGAGDCKTLHESGFNGGYTYFVGHKISEASSPDVWNNLQKQCSKYNIAFYPSVGPGYHDLSVRPWNSAASKSREYGSTYLKIFNQAMTSQPNGIGIVSFNEWHEGTQIEPAIPFKWAGYLTESRIYMDYLPYTPEFYLRLTRLLVNKFEKFIHLPNILQKQPVKMNFIICIN
ncbi:unnamed protein product [Heterobilharzia americana]|nr:unnamed protein product [Heterobilharzia americana]